VAGAASEYTLELHAAETHSLAKRLARPLTPLFKIFSVLISNDAKINFDTSSTPDGTAWTKLKFPRARGGDVPLRDRGLLMASMVGRGSGAVVRITGVQLEQGTNLEYARIQNEGGTVVPVKGKYLAIPLTPEAARAGGARHFPRPLRVIIGKRGGVLVEQSAPAVAKVARRTLKSTQRKLKQAVARVKKGKGRGSDKAVIDFLRSKVKSLRTRVSARVKASRSAGKVQYALTKRVVIPARQFIGFGKRLVDKIERAALDWFGVGEDK
jgi:phage gpG-like protein